MVRDPDCMNKIYSVSELDDIVFNEIKKLRLEPITVIATEKQDITPILKQDLDKIETQKKRLLDLYLTGKYSIAILDEKMEELESRKDKIETQLSANQNKITRKQAVELSVTFDEVLEKADFNETRQIIETLIDHIDIDGDDVYIHWRFA